MTMKDAKALLILKL